MVSVSEVCSYQRSAYFREEPNPMCRTMWSTVYLRSFVGRIFERLRLLDGGIGTFEA